MNRPLVVLVFSFILLSFGTNTALAGEPKLQPREEVYEFPSEAGGILPVPVKNTGSTYANIELNEPGCVVPDPISLAGSPGVLGLDPRENGILGVHLQSGALLEGTVRNVTISVVDQNTGLTDEMSYTVIAKAESTPTPEINLTYDVSPRGGGSVTLDPLG